MPAAADQAPATTEPSAAPDAPAPSGVSRRVVRPAPGAPTNGGRPTEAAAPPEPSGRPAPPAWEAGPEPGADGAPSGVSKARRGQHLIAPGARLSMAELESQRYTRGAGRETNICGAAGPRRAGSGKSRRATSKPCPPRYSRRPDSGEIFGGLKRFFIGAPISTAAAGHERLSKLKALACSRRTRSPR